jgi:hypothetical protein
VRPACSLVVLLPELVRSLGTGTFRTLFWSELGSIQKIKPFSEKRFDLDMPLEPRFCNVSRDVNRFPAITVYIFPTQFNPEKSQNSRDMSHFLA